MENKGFKTSEQIDLSDLDLMERRVAELERYLGIED